MVVIAVQYAAKVAEEMAVVEEGVAPTLMLVWALVLVLSVVLMFMVEVLVLVLHTVLSIRPVSLSEIKIEQRFGIGQTPCFSSLDHYQLVYLFHIIIIIDCVLKSAGMKE